MNLNARRPSARFQHFGAQNIGGHQIGRELHALGVEAQHRAERIHQQRLGQPRHTHQQRMTAGEDRGEGLVHHLVLADDALGDLGLGALQRLGGAFGLRHRVGSRGGVGD